MSNQIEFKRVTKSNLIQLIVIMILIFLIFALVLNSIIIAILATVDLGLKLLFLYSLDKKVKTSISLPINIFLSACLLTTLFFVLSNLSIPLALNLIIVIVLFFSNVYGGFRQLKTPPYVFDGKYYIEDANKYNIKVLKILLLILSILLIFSVILNIVLTLWKNSLI